MTGALRSCYPISAEPKGDTSRINKKMTDDIQNRGLQESEDDYSDGEGGSTGGVRKVLTRISK